MEITIKVESDYLVDLLIQRLDYWTSDQNIKELYRGYYQCIIDCFDGGEFDPSIIVDNDYINYTSVITEDEFEDFGIEDEDDERILYIYEPYKGDKLYLISTC